MNENLEQKLFNDFPNLYKPQKPETQTLMCFGFECSDGWYDLIYRMSEDLNKIEDLPEGFEIIQVKEKFGTLRVYTINGNEKAFERINQAEQESSKTCEVCGSPGFIRGNRWLQTLCESCSVK